MLDISRRKPRPSPAHSQPLTHRGNIYTRLCASEQSSLYLDLLQSRHSRDRLILEGYTFVVSDSLTATPKPSPLHPKRKAVVLDCEMAGGAGLPDQVVAISVIDFLTGETLLNTLAQPTGPITQWRSQITGITRARKAAAIASGDALRGRDEVLERLFEHVDQETVLVGHSVRNDLRALGLGHGRILDTGILTAMASGRFEEHQSTRRTAPLERLCRELVGLRIREDGGQEGHHDSLEDVLATREVVIWCLRHPGEMEEWAVWHWWIGAGAEYGRSGRGRARLSGKSCIEALSGSDGFASNRLIFFC